MELTRPMDRLVVGDVGYGKTEVALRAAFKAVQDGVQVAVLVPTTVLAAQHEATFSQRFAAFPLEVRLLSRFVSPTTQAATIAGTRFGFAEGELIHTENSYKYAIPEFRALAQRAGFAAVHTWTDKNALFSVHYFRQG